MEQTCRERARLLLLLCDQGLLAGSPWRKPGCSERAEEGGGVEKMKSVRQGQEYRSWEEEWC